MTDRKAHSNRPEKLRAEKDIRIAGGANAIQQFLKAGLVDEFTIHYSPVFFGQGTPLFSTTSNVKTKIMNTIASRETTHVTYEAREVSFATTILRALIESSSRKNQ